MRIIIVYDNNNEGSPMFPKKFVSISVASCLISNAALAQQVDTAQNQVIEEVLVSGQYLYNDTINALKTPTPILDVPQSLSIVSAEDIRARGFNSIGEVVNYLPGVTTSQGRGIETRLCSGAFGPLPTSTLTVCEMTCSTFDRFIT